MVGGTASAALGSSHSNLRELRKIFPEMVNALITH